MEQNAQRPLPLRNEIEGELDVESAGAVSAARFRRRLVSHITDPIAPHERNIPKDLVGIGNPVLIVVLRQVTARSPGIAEDRERLSGSKAIAKRSIEAKVILAELAVPSGYQQARSQPVREPSGRRAVEIKERSA
jgi:hypothetical protein